jgi:predicted O-linked N-acetylglucosamine transferase (SPINDLY family)
MVLSLESAISLYHQRKLREADAVARQIVQSDTTNVGAMNLLGAIANDVGRFDLAAQWFLRILEIAPAQAQVLNNLGEAYRRMGDARRAMECFGAAIQRYPEDALAPNNLALVLDGLGRVDEAIEIWRDLTHKHPGFCGAWNNLATALLKVGLIDEAIAHHLQAMELEPENAGFHSNLLRALQHLPDITGEALLSAHRQWWEKHGASLRRADEYRNDRDRERTLRVGWVTPDLREHSVAFFAEPILAQHDRDRMRMFVYADVAREDDFTWRAKSYVDTWRSVLGSSDEEVAQQIETDRIDVLIDLAGHTASNRACLFAKAPAPVAVCYLGYPSTTGIETIALRITDAVADPPGVTDAHYTERLARLDRSAWCYRPHDSAPEVAPSPALSRGYVTFGSFNALAKVNERVIDAWAEILRRAQNARLVIKSAALGEGASVRRGIADAFAARGIDVDRLTLVGKDETIPQHLTRYHDIDIALDTFPYNGTTTTCEALWMGVPVVSIAGTLHEARVGASLLGAVGLDEWVTNDVEQYIERASSFAKHPEILAELRRGLRQRMIDSPLRDEQGMARHFESALRSAWRDWCGRGNR